MSRISKIEFTEIDRSIKNKYSIYVENNKCYIENNIFSSLNKNTDKILISNAEYELIINHLQKYYKILFWKNIYESKDYTVNKNEWSLTIYEDNLIIKEIFGNNGFPKNYNSFKNYIINKYNTLKIQ